ncbi:hypothetical protein MMC30_002981 [Trapelia coarctata]|nr:hypothetical protein [Trapelia coarctata]
MRGLRKAAVWLLPALATALVIQNEDISHAVFSSTGGSPNTGTNAIIDYQPENGFVKFNVPCPGCSEEERKAIEEAAFAFSVFETRRARCLDESGVLFPGKREKGYGPRGQGSFGLEIEEDSELEGARGLWSISCVCLNAEAARPCLPENYVRVLVFSLRSIGRYPHPGFTITYKDSDKPEILKVSLVPDDEALLDLTKSTHWHNPTISANPSVPLIDVGLYHSTLLDQSFSSPTGSNPSIPLSTSTSFTSSGAFTISAARPAATQIQVDIDVVHSVSATPAPEPTVTTSINLDLQANQPMKIIEHVFNVFETKAKELVQAAMDARPGSDAQNFLSSEITSVVKDVESISNEIVNSGERIPPLPSALDSVTLSIKADTNVEITPSATTSDATPSPSKSPVRSTLRTDQTVRAFQITSVIIIIVLLLTFIFVYLFRNPRRRADRAARAEERRRRRLYRRAARQHKWRSWFGRLRGTFVPNHDGPTAEAWEEKQLIAVQTDGPSLREMRRELRALRNAHTVIDGIVRAEEGRTDGNSSTSRIRRVERRNRSYSESTADSVPPTYEASVTIVNGFPYTPNGTDSTPDSSVIDTSPRTSIYLSNSDSEKD